MDQEHTFVWEEHIPGGCHWSGIVRRGTTLRLVDIAGGANAAVLFFNQEEKLERYNMADTLKAQHTARLTRGHVCYSDMGRVLCSIAADSAGWHDPLCGPSDAATTRARYGEKTYQDARNDMHRNGRDGLLIELEKWGLGKRDLAATVNVVDAPSTVVAPASIRATRVTCADPVSANGYTTTW